MLAGYGALYEGLTAMRRKDKEIRDKMEIEAVIRAATVCRLAMMDGLQPYIVPLCFGYRDDVFYFHSANTGRKLELLRCNNRVCFELDVDCRVTRGEEACNWGMAFKSVVGYGKAEFLEDPSDKRRALQALMQQYAGRDSDFVFEDAQLRHTTVFRVRVERMTGKRSG
jgi:nitroimidazol reductase NimA-like FMN-containing flavoprotein (pyridoxamine 5'-phosphate oxidase superfamily)